ncbi:peroxisomal acyl-coenzyme A oxidase 3 isoform X1 [Sitophilus oryzae]|uniref:Acyl-coenzyme A oxidase n=2 Tax=Sitophilus oryzae TaxID=7048 RepID=A0A6J2YGZ3_SITOR|nr:peroxisomal acyl-coenzyme A oxidase 3 isoform X1 [Sitophilus oryzae]XP_030762698.1 peroxisomal acyl-coenzyme A oxidase 3 isoform X1 [Sitophilus oryzae]XP_030762699.1 peroxisomal acyl-coenzyme A oxidase 3 isoform X1 [Sitophilus oryzae]
MASSTKDLDGVVNDLPPGPLDTYRKQAKFHWKQMKLFFEDAELLKIKMKVWNTLERDPTFQRPKKVPDSDEMKRLAAIQLHKYCHYNFLHPDTAKLPYKRKTKFMMTVNEALAVAFPDVSIKHAVGIGLFKNALSTLGTERHQHFVDASWNNQVLACLALTEIAHGSNTKQMRTTATYDEKTQEFIINTPDFKAAKCWVGNLGKTCTVAVLFAQLYTKGHCHGLHAFVVPVRDPNTLLPYPGLIIGDMGEKIGLHGIDNGFILFKDYRIPRENLLNRTADVTPDGEYESSFSEPGKILGAALESLSTGRVGIMQESSNNLICAVTIAIRYAAIRKQFGPNGDGGNTKNEWPLIEYQLHRWRLFPHMAAAAILRTFVTSFTDTYLSAVELSTTSKEFQNLSDVVSEVHAIVSSAKALVTWSCRDAIQECREACGGHAFMKASRLGDLRTTNDPCVTYEGDNNVLLQQTSNWLLRQWQNLTQGNKLTTPLGSCKFLENHRFISSQTFRVVESKTLTSQKFISECYEWLIVYLLKQTDSKQSEIERRTNKFVARAESQVYCAALLSKVYIEYLALNYFWAKVCAADSTLINTLNNLGALYGLSSLEKHLVYFYQGSFTNNSNFSKMIKDTILFLCDILKPEALGIIDGMAPPDFVVNSVIGRSDGKLYENLEAELMHGLSVMSRPDWWREIVINNPPDFMRHRSKL